MPLRALIALIGLCAATSSLAQSFPSRPVKITAPYSPGAAPATFTHVVADKLSKLWGQPVIVESRPGAIEPREVTAGRASADRVEIVRGLRAGERIVTSGHFLLDSESRLTRTP